MKTGRNDPCPCGSGKKYKKCCLAKDEGAARVAAASAPLLSLVPPPLDPKIEAANARWDEFESADYEGQITLFRQTLDAPELADEAVAFEMLDVIYQNAIERDERDRFDALLLELRQQQPEVYAEDAHYYLDWLITHAIAAGRFEAIPPLARELAGHAGHDIDTFNNVIDMLAYHGQLATIVDMLRIAWPLVEKSRNVVPWAIDEFSASATDYEVLHYLEHHAEPDPHDAQLIERLEFYCPIDSVRLVRFIDLVTGRLQRHWTLGDFALQPRPEKPEEFFLDDDWVDEDEAGENEAEPVDEGPVDEGRHNLLLLRFEFAGYLRRVEGIPYPKAELASAHIYEYLVRRFDGTLEPQESLIDVVMHPRRPKLPPRREPMHPLCPDVDTFDRYLAELLSIFNPQYYKMTATFELTPAWLRFLESRHLIEAEQRRATLAALRKLHTDLLKLATAYRRDPALERMMQGWPDDADRLHRPTT